MLRIRIRMDPSLIYSPEPVSECGPELGFSYKKVVTEVKIKINLQRFQTKKLFKNNIKNKYHTYPFYLFSCIATYKWSIWNLFGTFHNFNVKFSRNFAVNYFANFAQNVLTFFSDNKFFVDVPGKLPKFGIQKKFSPNLPEKFIM